MNLKMNTRRLLHVIVNIILRVTFLPYLLREVYARNKITLVNYHDPEAKVFERHMRKFSRIYSFIDIETLADALRKRNFGNLPVKPLLVTLDDGHRGNAKLFEIMKKYNVPAVIYFVAGVVNSNRHFWFKTIGSIKSDCTELKRIRNEERLRRLKERFNHMDELEYRTRQALSIREVNEFLAVGGTAGSHSVFHPMLNRCEDEVILNECIESRRITEALTGSPVLHFAYPGGAWDNRIKELVRRSGYRTARTTDPGWVTATTDPLALPNFGISDDAGVSKAIVQASGLWGMMKRSLGLPQ